MQFSEKFLYHIWDAQHLKPELKTISGKTLKIKFQGQFNTDSGPDFKNAIIQIDYVSFRGDIEIHLKTYDWIAHKHDENRNFNKTILHVVFEHNGKYSHTINENGELIEILELCNFLDKDISKLLAQYSEKPFNEKDKFCSFFAGLHTDTVEQILIKLGKMRFEKKIKRFDAELHFSDFNQLLLQGLFSALGYSKNKFQMFQLSSDYSYYKLKKYLIQGMTKDEMMAILLCSSDLINHLPVTFPDELKTKWQEIYTNQDYSKESFNYDWKLFRIRPTNHPAIRILQISDLLYKNLKVSFFNNILKIFSFELDTFSLKDFRNKFYLFFQSDSEYLPEKYNIGKTRLDTILINIILPLAVLYARKMSYFELEQVASQVYQNFHNLPDNYILKYMQNFLDDSQKKIIRKKAIFQQGILQLYFDFCLYHNCKGCESFKASILSEM